MRLYEIRNELEEKATRRFQMDFGPLYTEELKKEIIDLEYERRNLDYEEEKAISDYYKSIEGRGVTVGGAKPHIDGIRKKFADKKREVEQKLNKAKYEYDSKQENKNDEIFKLSPEFYGVGINLVSLWKKIKSWF